MQTWSSEAHCVSSNRHTMAPKWHSPPYQLTTSTNPLTSFLIRSTNCIELSALSIPETRRTFWHYTHPQVMSLSSKVSPSTVPPTHMLPQQSPHFLNRMPTFSLWFLTQPTDQSSSMKSLMVPTIRSQFKFSSSLKPLSQSQLLQLTTLISFRLIRLTLDLPALRHFITLPSTRSAFRFPWPCG